MPGIPVLQGSNLIDTVGENAADTTGVTVTSAGSNNSKGSYVELVASTPFATYGILLQILLNQAQDYLFDIAIGSSGNEKILIENLQCSCSRPPEAVSPYFIPVRIPAGTRLSIRCQATQASQSAEIIAMLIGGGNLLSDPLSRVTTYGVNTSDSGGAGVDPGGTAHTKGSYAEVVASTTNPIKQLLVIVGDRNNATMTTCTFLIDIAVGGSGSEKLLLPDLFCGAGTQTDGIIPNVFGPFPVNIPAGTRIAARAQCSIIDATDRLIDITLIGVD